MADERSRGGAGPERPDRAGGAGPTALPTPGARAIAFVAIVVGGICGLLIGWALVQLQCTGSCDLQIGLGMLGGALLAALGMSVIAVLVLRAMGEWQDRSQSARR